MSPFKPQKLPWAAALAGDASGGEGRLPAAQARWLQRLGYDIARERSLPLPLPALPSLVAPSQPQGPAWRAAQRARIVPRINSLRYDPVSGSLLVYRRAMDGGLLWRRLRDGVAVHEKAGLDEEPPLHVLANTAARLLPVARPRIAELPSGYVEVSSPAMAQLLRERREHFLDTQVHAPVGYFSPLDENTDLSGGEPAGLRASTSFVADSPLAGADASAAPAAPDQSHGQGAGTRSLGAAAEQRRCQSTPLRGGRKTRPLAAQLAGKSSYRRGVREGAQHVQEQLLQQPALAAQLMDSLFQRDPDSLVWSQHSSLAVQREQVEAADLWSRSLYAPPKDTIRHVPVRLSRRKQHYRLKYQWIPQPLVHNAVNNLYHQRRYSASHRSAMEQQQREQQREQQSAPAEPSCQRGLYASSSVYLSDQLAPFEFDGVRWDCEGGEEVRARRGGKSARSEPADSAKHPRRQHPLGGTLEHPRLLVCEEEEEDDVSSLQTSDSLLEDSTIASRQSLNASQGVAISMRSAPTVPGALHTSSTALRSSANSFQTYLQSVPEGRLPDAEAMKKAVRATRDSLSSAQSPPRLSTELMHVRKKGVARKFRYRYPALGNAQSRKDSVHPHHWL
jgi:hypothetical protein